MSISNGFQPSLAYWKRIANIINWNIVLQLLTGFDHARVKIRRLSD